MSRWIDADAVKESIKDTADLGGWIGEALYQIKQLAIKYIDSAPTIEAVSVVHGEWIDAEIPLESGGSMPIQACNLCKTFYPLAYTGGGHRFCPNCGAKMDGERKESE